MRVLALMLAGLFMVGLAQAADTVEVVEDKVLPDRLFPQVELQTSAGTIVVELDRMRAPATANNFLRYVLDGRYEGTVFHRVIEDFVVQGGGYLEDMSPIETFGPILNESGNGLSNRVGTIAMARQNEPHSATSQFYFNVADNDKLDPNPSRWGYTVFGRVTEGLGVLQDIAAVETGYHEAIDNEDVPQQAIVLQKARVLPAPELSSD